MPYFSDSYPHLSYPIATPNAGLYNAQLGAIHAIASHFTLHEEPALVNMPTGSGKTAVLMMTPFVIRATRALVITPSRMVREQIAEDFAGLVSLRRASAIPVATRSPRVKEVKGRVRSAATWESLRDFEVVVSTPNCVSPTYEDIPAPPVDLFDLVLIDEAHHSSATTWAELIKSLPASRKVLFTATPFRRDREEIPARFIYSYPVDRAFRDGIFGRIRYIPVEPVANQTNDVAIASAAAAAFQEDRNAGLNHFVMVRTDTMPRANELLETYTQATPLRLALVHSRIPKTRVRTILDDLNASRLDGIVCVNMLGEGFNFPRLKIAAIHAPHRSLEVTLQFIGRFARTNANDIGEAKFLAVRNEIELEGERLFDDRAVWQEMIQNLTYGRVVEEIEVRAGITAFSQPIAGDSDLSDLSLYSLHPRSHVKVYDVRNHDVALDHPIRIGHHWHERYRNLTADKDALVVVYRRIVKPAWSAGDLIIDSNHILLIVYHDVARHLLFVNSSEPSDGLYDAVVDTVAFGARRLSMAQLRRVLRRLQDQRVFNYGMRNIQATNAAESYRITAGPNAGATLSPMEARLYRQGHAFVSGDVDGEKVTVGYSSGSKVWSAAQTRIPILLSWCRTVAAELRSEAAVVTHSGLDYLPAGVVVADLPPNIVLAQWHHDAFRLDDPIQVEYEGDDAAIYRPLLMDLELTIDRPNTTATTLALSITGPQLTYSVLFSVDEADDEFYAAAAGENEQRISVRMAGESLSLIEYLNAYYLDLYTADGGALIGNELSTPIIAAAPVDQRQLIAWDWQGVDIESEIDGTQVGISVQQHVRARLQHETYDVVFCDHGSGEIADFVGLTQAGDTLTFTFLHCKGSSEPQPGARVADVYEVCGQAQKSVVWRDVDRIRRRLDGRIAHLDYVRGDRAALEALLVAANVSRQQFKITIVQPGISTQRITQPLLENLGATSAHVSRSGFELMEVITSI
jgi:superfamily II DNA or RNA helicase